MLAQTVKLFKARHVKEKHLPAGKVVSFYPQLNGFRCIFVFMVLLHHWGSQDFFQRYRIGWVGVDLFFVLSGFLIGEILLKEKQMGIDKMVAIRNFVVRRILRIFPLYYAVVILYSVFVTSGGIFWWNVTYTNNILQAFHLERVKKDFWHLWSLCVEEQFYIFFPFFLFFSRKRVFEVLLIAGIVLSFFGRVTTAAFTEMTDPHALMPFCLDSLFLGVLLAHLKTSYPHILNRLFKSQFTVLVAVTLLVAAMAWVCFKNNLVSVYGFLRLFGSIAGFLLIGFSVIRGFKGPLKYFLENRFVSLIGKISYGVYLLHPFIGKFYYQYADKNLIRKYLVGLRLPLISNLYLIDFFFLFTITIIISYLSFQLFEKKFLKLKLLFP
jgi:peptidoglycan/LPS O-acetylase OafA/YrhL